jgi:hypothetical protein
MAIKNHYNWLCAFGGGGWDLGIRVDGKDGWSSLGASYELPAGMKYQSDEAKSYLASCGLPVRPVV